MYSIDEKVLADNRSIISLCPTKDDIEKDLKAGMLAYTFNDKYLYIVNAKGVYGQVVCTNGITNSITNDITFDGNILIKGNLNVLGSNTSINSDTLEVEDNMVVINKNETGDGITLGYAGLEIERGTKPNVYFVFQENIKNNIGGLVCYLGDKERLFTIYENKEVDYFNTVRVNNYEVLTKEISGVVDPRQISFITTGLAADLPEYAEKNTYYLALDQKKLYYNISNITNKADWQVALDGEGSLKNFFKEEFVLEDDEQKEFILKDANEHTTIERINVYIDGALVPQSAYTFDNPNICFLNPPGKGYTIIIQYFN